MESGEAPSIQRKRVCVFAWSGGTGDARGSADSSWQGLNLSVEAARHAGVFVGAEGSKLLFEARRGTRASGFLEWEEAFETEGCFRMEVSARSGRRNGCRPGSAISSREGTTRKATGNGGRTGFRRQGDESATHARLEAGRRPVCGPRGGRQTRRGRGPGGRGGWLGVPRGCGRRSGR